MKSSKSKVLHEIGGMRLIDWAQACATGAGCETIVAVVGESNADVNAAASSAGMDIAIQEPQLGTGHAVDCARESVERL